MSDGTFDRTILVTSVVPTESCLVVTRPQRRQAPGHDDGFGCAEAIVMAYFQTD